MAKFVGGPPPFVGTRDNVTIYVMNGEYFIRSKSSLTGKRVKRDPAFARTMEYAGWLKKAAVIASLVYRQLPENGRVYRQYRELVGKAMRLLKEGFDVDAVLIVLEAGYLPDKLSDDLPEEDNTFVRCAELDKSYKERSADKKRGIVLYQVFEKEASVKRRKSIGSGRFQVERSTIQTRCTVFKS
ncbi:hypothetical protein [Chitinophaga ginsengisoli]|uniref:Uncharacterized protein n=1 Tax=Chitinophaga ginsengisoli TaxID=363837 RepID=A0A2P8GLC2_9BACT|nr:hypothetical protein [Chitinophaga ginsengisoli]PSL34756.1 hypothetical protein CLV42_102329 [Chitinophaga ginsengisoli]